jgi:hypothetical protein
VYHSIKNFLLNKISKKEPIEQYFQTFNTEDGKRILAWATDIGAPDKYDDLVITFSKHDPKTRASFGFMKSKEIDATNPVAVITIHNMRDETVDYPKMVNSLLMNDFVHEFVHYMDFLRYGPRYKASQVMARKGPSDISTYVNSPTEFNAYYQEIVSNVLRDIPRANRDVLAHSFGDIRSFIKTVYDTYFPTFFTNNLNEIYHKKLLRRLAMVYNETVRPVLIKMGILGE